MGLGGNVLTRRQERMQRCCGVGGAWWRVRRKKSYLRLVPNAPSLLWVRLSSSISLSLTDEEVGTIDRLAADILLRNDDASRNRAVSSGDMIQRISLAKAITLVESKSTRKRLMADMLLQRLKQIPSNKSSFRIGIAGPPGVGKSTFVEKFGSYILDMKDNKEHAEPSSFRPDKLAVLCIDPSSHATGGSILGGTYFNSICFIIHNWV